MLIWIDKLVQDLYGTNDERAIKKLNERAAVKFGLVKTLLEKPLKKTHCNSTSCSAQITPKNRRKSECQFSHTSHKKTKNAPSNTDNCRASV